MSDKTPITTIQNLFSNYKDEETVYAKEYNANIQALKEAIEYNGSILKENKEAVKSLSAGNIPAEGIGSEQIAEDAVTEEKLSPSIRNNMLFKNSNVASYFGDFLLQLYKTNTSLRGAFMNGSISDIGVEFKIPTEYTTTVTQNNTLKVYLGSDDKITTLLNVKNKYSPEKYRFCPYCAYGCTVSEASAEWVTTYTLEQPMVLDSGATLGFSYTTGLSDANYERHTRYDDFYEWYSTVDVTLSIKAIDDYGNTTDITKYFTSSTEKIKGTAESLIRKYTLQLNPASLEDSLENIKFIVVTTNLILEPKTSDRFGDVIMPSYSAKSYITLMDNNYAQYVHQMYFSTGASTLSNEDSNTEYTGLAIANCNIPNVELCYKVQGTIPEERLTEAFSTEVFCSADIIDGIDLCLEKGYPSALYVGAKLQDIMPVPGETNSYLITKTFTAPYAVVFDLIDTVEIYGIDTFEKGTYKLTRDPYHGFKYIDDRNYEQFVRALLDNGYVDGKWLITNVRRERFDIGATGVQYKIKSMINGLKLDSICAVRY